MRRCSHITALSALVAASFLSAPAMAEQVYKWVDDTGRVHYGNKPPDGSKGGQVQKVEPKISTIPFNRPDPGEVRAMQEREQRRREQFERDTERRAASSAARGSLEEAARYWRERCYAERRVDCDGPAPSYLYDPGFAFAPGYGAFYPPVIRARPRPPIAYFPDTAPPGFRVGPGPAGIGAGYVPLPERAPYAPMRAPERAKRH